jgi:hypothetical protein
LPAVMEERQFRVAADILVIECRCTGVEGTA